MNMNNITDARTVAVIVVLDSTEAIEKFLAASEIQESEEADSE